MGKCKALETALNNKLLSSHEHLKKGIFSPTPLYWAQFPRSESGALDLDPTIDFGYRNSFNMNVALL
jgi:hypothetical protein